MIITDIDKLVEKVNMRVRRHLFNHNEHVIKKKSGYLIIKHRTPTSHLVFLLPQYLNASDLRYGLLPNFCGIADSFCPVCAVNWFKALGGIKAFRAKKGIT